MLNWIGVLICCVALLVSNQASGQLNGAVNPTSPIQLQKAYQQVLYEYYQGNFGLALTQMAILEQKFPNGLTQLPSFLSANQVEPELLKGGMSLAYGLDNQAADIFQRLLQNNTAPKITAFAWLLLGKTYYQKNQFAAAAQALQNIPQQDAVTHFEVSVRDNWLYMQSQLHDFLLDQETTSTNTQWLEQLSSDSIYRHYVQYNQALGLLQAGKTQQAISRLTALVNNNNSFVRRWMGWADPIFNHDSDPNLTAERDAIGDRANLTLGYTLLQNDEPHEAFRVFQKIRTQGLDTQAALLGYGWAAAKKDELQSALAVWQRLIMLPQNNEYTLEAYLASAYAYEKAFAPQQSLQVLRLGINRFEQALTDLNHAEQQVQQQSFILGLLPDAKSRSEQTDVVSQSLIDKGRQFNTVELFNSVAVSREFRAGLSALEDNKGIQKQLYDWQQRMQQYHLMLNERQAERSKRAQQTLQNRTLEQLTELQTQREALAQQVASAKEQKNAHILMNQQSQQWLFRVGRAQKSIEKIAQLKQQLGQKPLDDSYHKRVKRVAGRITWQTSEAHAANLWQAQKALNQLDDEIAKAQIRQQQLLQQLALQPEFTQQRQRVSGLAQRISAEVTKSTQLQNVLVSQLSDTFVRAIQEHKQKIADYILQAQLAMVRLRDQALQKDNNSSTKTDEATSVEEEQL